MSLQDVVLKSEYHSLEDNMANDFYIPLLSEGILYQRAVGFFSSTILVKISSGIANLARKSGKIQIIASPYLSDSDIEAIKKGYEDKESLIREKIQETLLDAKNYNETNRLNLLANLIADGILDIKIAYTEKHGELGMFHDKFGIISDSQGNSVAFSGSMNESLTAISYNYESIDVYSSWKNDVELQRVNDKQNRFDNIWNNQDENVVICDGVNINEEIVKKYKKFNPDFTIDEPGIILPSEEYETQFEVKQIYQINTPLLPSWLNLYDYQKEAIECWKSHDYIGIYDMATGTGKTLTALASLTSLFKDEGRIAVVICCPYQHLVDQWVEDITEFNITPIVAYSGHNYKRKLDDAVFNYNLGVTDFFCLICTNGTYIRNNVQSQISKIKGNALIIVDEAHNFGASSLSKKMSSVFNFRLALSATLDRHGDTIGTKKLYDYFGEKCISYDLERAIQENKLTPYIYKPIVVSLTQEELQEYERLSDIISKHIIEKDGKTELDEFGKIKAQERSRLVAGAFNKIGVLKELMKEHIDELNMLVYCGATKISKDYTSDEDIRQIDFISRMLGNELDMSVAQFTSNEDAEERKKRIKAFTEGDVQALIAIKCLDEGVNIPKIKTAFILASTTNPKEYIQRRGRVLRKAVGKEFAVIYDFITIPREISEISSQSEYELQKDKSLVKKELARMKEFKDQSMNPLDSDKLINELMNLYSLYDYSFEDNFITEELEDE